MHIFQQITWPFISKSHFHGPSQPNDLRLNTFLLDLLIYSSGSPSNSVMNGTEISVYIVCICFYYIQSWGFTLTKAKNTQGWKKCHLLLDGCVESLNNKPWLHAGKRFVQRAVEGLNLIKYSLLTIGNSLMMTSLFMSFS